MYPPVSEEKTIKIPVVIANDGVKYFYGGDLPDIKKGAVGELILSEYAIKDSRFLAISQNEEKVEILPSGIVIMVAVNADEVAKDLKQY